MMKRVVLKRDFIKGYEKILWKKIKLEKQSFEGFHGPSMKTFAVLKSNPNFLKFHF